MFAAVESGARREALRSRVQGLLRRAAARAGRLAENLAGDALRATRAEAEGRCGELLKANLHRIKRGTRSIEVDDFLGGGGPVGIPLDPALGPVENMERCFRRARRFRGRSEDLERRRAAAEEERKRLIRLLDEAAAAVAERLGELEGELVREPAGRREAARAARRAEPRLPYHEHRSRAGEPIRVGRGGRDNDELTFRLSRGNDIWLHVKGFPGAHVVVPVRAGRRPSDDTIRDAAALAVVHSKAPEGSGVEVARARLRDLVDEPRDQT
jgi:predicted ribosome quality control (RQC) complex YloA/Tae2 family protein